MMARKQRLRLMAAVLATVNGAAAGAASAPSDAMAKVERASSPSLRNFSGVLAGGARWNAVVPPHWKGTLLVWSRGYQPTASDPAPAPEEYRDALLARGYALLASDYGSGGWALAEAGTAQRGAMAAFSNVAGRPRRIIAWGASMGSLVTLELAEKRSPVDGALALCPSIGGAVGMMNMALDGAFTFRTLAAPDAGLELTSVSDDGANGARARDAVHAAMASPAGRARLALAGVLGGIPGWTQPDHPRPAAGDARAQVDEMAATFVMALFPPRQDQESRAGGAYSWNTGIDYRKQLALSGRRGLIEDLYHQAGLNLEADLATLAATPRLVARKSAIGYMMRHYTPTARPLVPLVAMQAIGDGLTSPSLQRAYVDAASSRMVRGLWYQGAGHCRFPVEAVLPALDMLEKRIVTGRWTVRPRPFIRYRPAPMLRSCIKGRTCR